MAGPLNSVFTSEKRALDELKRRVARGGRSPVFVLAGPKETRLKLVLQMLTNELGGRYFDLSTRGTLEDLRTGSPLYGRDIGRRLSDTVLRQFIEREVRAANAPLIAISAPPTIWKIMSATDLDGPQRFLRGLVQWASPRPLILSYALDADPASLTAEELRGILTLHLIEIRMSKSEIAYLEGQTEGMIDANQ